MQSRLHTEARKTNHTEGTLKTGVVLVDGVRDAKCRDAGVNDCRVLLAEHNITGLVKFRNKVLFYYYIKKS